MLKFDRLEMKGLGIYLMLVFVMMSKGLSAQDIQIIELSPNISVTWYSDWEMLKKDDTFKKMEAKFEDYVDELLLLLTDTTMTSFELCRKEGFLRHGDFAWMLLRELRKIPKDCPIRRFNTIKGMCPYPVGLLDYMEENREEAAKDLRECVERE